MVTDSKGVRVTDLGKDDFEVFSGRDVPQKVANFYSVGGGKVTFGDGTSVPLEDAEKKGELPPEVKARFVLYIDNLNIQPQNRNRMFGKLKDFVTQNVGPRAEAEVIAYNRSLKVKRKFTSDPTEILAALEEIERETGGGTSLAGERRDALHRIDESQSAADALNTARQYARSLRNDIEFDVDAIKNTLNGLAGIKGRKILVYVSEGLPATAGIELFDAVQKKYQQQASTLEAFEFDMNGKYAGDHPGGQRAGRHDLGARRLGVDEMVTAENRSFTTRPSDFLMRQNTQAPLMMMAEQTGGLASVNSNSWKDKLDELAKDFSSFYSLGYRTSRSAVDRPHSVVVNVKRKGLTARFRRSFLEKTPETQAAESVVASLFYPRDDNALGIHVTLGAQKPYDSENFAVPVRIAFLSESSACSPRRPVRGRVFRLCRGARFRGEAVGPRDPAAGRIRSGQGLDHRAVQGLVLRLHDDRRPGKPADRLRRPRRKHGHDLVLPEEPLHLAPAQVGREGGKAKDARRLGAAG